MVDVTASQAQMISKTVLQPFGLVDEEFLVLTPFNQDMCMFPCPPLFLLHYAGGAFVEPCDGGIVLFSSREMAQQFVDKDPYKTAGLVTSYKVGHVSIFICRLSMPCFCALLECRATVGKLRSKKAPVSKEKQRLTDGERSTQRFAATVCLRGPIIEDTVLYSPYGATEVVGTILRLPSTGS